MLVQKGPCDSYGFPCYSASRYRGYIDHGGGQYDHSGRVGAAGEASGACEAGECRGEIHEADALPLVDREGVARQPLLVREGRSVELPIDREGDCGSGDWASGVVYQGDVDGHVLPSDSSAIRIEIQGGEDGRQRESTTVECRRRLALLEVRYCG